MQSALDKLDVIECFEAPGQQLRVENCWRNKRKSTLAMGSTRHPRYECSGIQGCTPFAPSVEETQSFHLHFLELLFKWLMCPIS